MTPTSGPTTTPTTTKPTKPNSAPRTRTFTRAALLLLTLFAFGRVAWALEAKALWWDESLSLQRAESGLLDLLVGRLVMFDSVDSLLTIDQHPFFFFLLQGLLLRLAGDSEFVLRFVSVMAATLLVPTAWVFTRVLVRRGVAPSSSAPWAALFAAVSPFFLWYGQEARSYALWALLTLLSTYLLLRATEDGPVHRGWLLSYGLVLFATLTTHFYAVFMLPVHALVLLLWLWQRRRGLAIAAAIALLVMGGLIGGGVAYLILVRQGGGANFPHIQLGTLARDLLNAFSLGLSVDVVRVWWLDLVFGAVLLLGTGWSVHSRSALRRGGWIAPALLLTPIAIVLLVDLFHPIYMNARHLSLIGGPFIVLLGVGLGVVTARQRLLGVALALLLMAGVGMSTVNYFTLEEYDKDDFHRLGEYLDSRIMPGDLVVLKPPFSWRHFAYYLPNADITDPQVRANGIDVVGMPLLVRSWEESAAQLAELTASHARTWLLISGTHPYADLDGNVEAWFDQNMFQLDDVTYFSHSSLRSKLYLPTPPVLETPPAEVDYATDAVFGDQIRLYGYDLGPATGPGVAVPVTLYWQTLAKSDRRYKYVLRLEEQLPDGSWQSVAVTEREPYDGVIPTAFWDEGITVVEYSELPPPAPDFTAAPDRYRLTLQMYDGETLAKLPVTQRGEGETVVLWGRGKE